MKRPVLATENWLNYQLPRSFLWKWGYVRFRMIEKTGHFGGAPQMLWILKVQFNVEYDFAIKHYHIVRRLGFLNIQSTTNYYDRFFKNEGGVRFRTITEKWAIWEDPLKCYAFWKLKSNLVHDFVIQHDLIVRHTRVVNLGSRGLEQLQKNMHWCKMWHFGQIFS